MHTRCSYFEYPRESFKTWPFIVWQSLERRVVLAAVLLWRNKQLVPDMASIRTSSLIWWNIVTLIEVDKASIFTVLCFSSLCLPSISNCVYFADEEKVVISDTGIEVELPVPFPEVVRTPLWPENNKLPWRLRSGSICVIVSGSWMAWAVYQVREYFLMIALKQHTYSNYTEILPPMHLWPQCKTSHCFDLQISVPKVFIVSCYK